jgi:hypothetical protein
MIIAVVFSALPAIVLVCYLHLGTSLLWCVLPPPLTCMLLRCCSRAVFLLSADEAVCICRYYPAQALGGGVSLISLSLAYVADLLLPSHRYDAVSARYLPVDYITTEALSINCDC